MLYFTYGLENTVDTFISKGMYILLKEVVMLNFFVKLNPWLMY